MQFQFRQSRDRLRLNEISAAVDVEHARRNAGVLQGVLKSLTYGAVDDADIAGCTVGEVAHGLRLSQVALQYQQHTQRQLADCVKALNEKNARLEDVCGTLKAELDHHTKTASTLMHSTHEATAVEISRVRGELAHTQKDLDDERLANRRLTEDLMEARESIALLKERLRESRQVATPPNTSPAQNLSFNSVESTVAGTATVPAPNASTLQASIDHLARQLAMHAPPPPPCYPSYPPPAYAHAQPPPATYYPPSHPPPFPANAAPLHLDPYVQSMLAAHLSQQPQQQPPLPPREPSTGSRDSAVAPFPLAASHSSTAVARSSTASAASADKAVCESVASSRKEKKEKKSKAEKKGKKEKKEKKARRAEAEAEAEAEAASCEAPPSATHTAATPSPVLQKAAPPPAAAPVPAPATATATATDAAAAAVSPASATALAISPASAAPSALSPASGVAAPSLDDIQAVLRRRDEAKRRSAEECREANAALQQAELQGRGEASDEELLTRRGLLSAHFEQEADARAAAARRVEAAEAAARAERARQQEEEWALELERRRVQEQVSRSEEERERQMRRASASVIDPYTPTLLKPLASAAAPAFDAHGNESEGDNASSSEEAVRMPPAAQPAATSSVPQRAPLGLPPPAKQSAGSFGIPPAAVLATGAAGAGAAATEHDVSTERLGYEVMSAQGTVGSCPSLPNDSFSNNDMKLVMCDKCGDEVLEAAVPAHKQVCLHRDDDTGTSTSEDNGDTDEEDEPLPIHLSQRTPSVSWKLDNAPSVPEPALQRASSSLILQETRSQLEALEREQAAADRARNASSSSSSMMLDNPS